MGYECLSQACKLEPVPLSMGYQGAVATWDRWCVVLRVFMHLTLSLPVYSTCTGIPACSLELLDPTCWAALPSRHYEVCEASFLALITHACCKLCWETCSFVCGCSFPSVLSKFVSGSSYDMLAN